MAVSLAPPVKAPAPWEDEPAPAAAARGASLQHAAPLPVASLQPAAQDDELPPWVTEFSDSSAAALGAAIDDMEEPAPEAPPPRPSTAARPTVLPAVWIPVPGLDWDGNWPAVAAVLPLRGVAQQLAVQAELIECQHDAGATLFRVRVPIDTLRTPANVEKLAAALSERFQRTVSVDTEQGAVWHTASAQAQAQREACQREAVATIANDPFVQSLMRDLGAIVVPGSIAPAPAAH